MQGFEFKGDIRIDVAKLRQLDNVHHALYRVLEQSGRAGRYRVVEHLDLALARGIQTRGAKAGELHRRDRADKEHVLLCLRLQRIQPTQWRVELEELLLLLVQNQQAARVTRAVIQLRALGIVGIVLSA